MDNVNNEKNDEKAMSALFTGHRELPAGCEYELSEKIKKTVVELYKLGVRNFYAGGAIGFDMLAAFCVILKRYEYPDIKLILALPCKDHDAKWGQKNKKDFRKVLSMADEVIYVSENYFSGCMLKRDRYMVDRASYCICYLNKKTGGTAYTVGYAGRNSREIINLAL